MDSVAIWDSSSEEETDKLVDEKIQRQILRNQSNILDLPDKVFIKNFRLSKDAFLYVLSEIECELKVPRRSTAVSNVIKLATTLRFLAEGGHQHGTGAEVLISLAQQTVSIIITEVCDAIEKKLCPKWIHFFTEEEKKESKEYFYKKSGFPGIIGAIGGTHIQIIRPAIDEQLFFNRKLKHSLNAMVICDHNMKIRAVDARYGGSCHDSYVWGLSDERNSLETAYNNGDKSTWLIGDSGYPLEPWLMTPYKMSTEGSPEAKFNTSLSKLRNIIDRLLDILKGRFRCLLAARELHYSPEKAIKMFNVCCALHNICIDYKIPLEENNISQSVDILSNFVETLPANAPIKLIGKKIRDNIKNILP